MFLWLQLLPAKPTDCLGSMHADCRPAIPCKLGVPRPEVSTGSRTSRCSRLSPTRQAGMCCGHLTLLMLFATMMSLHPALYFSIVRLRLCCASRDSLSTSFSSSTLKPLLPADARRQHKDAPRQHMAAAHRSRHVHVRQRCATAAVGRPTREGARCMAWCPAAAASIDLPPLTHTASPASLPWPAPPTCHIQWSVLGQLLDDLLHHVAVLAANITGVQLHMVVAAQAHVTVDTHAADGHHVRGMVCRGVLLSGPGSLAWPRSVQQPSTRSPH